MSYKNQIDNIFSSSSIYKSLIICCNSYVMKDLYDNMRDDEYPVTDIIQLNKFKLNDSRVLLINEVDFHNIKESLENEYMDMINAVFFVGCEKNHETMFNDNNIKYYVIQ